MFEKLILLGIVIVFPIVVYLIIRARYGPEVSEYINNVSTGDETEKNDDEDGGTGGLGVSIGPDGVGLSINLGSGLGIDPSDGSLTVNIGGGIHLDTD